MDIATITPLSERIVELYTKGLSPKDISFSLGISKVEVVRELSKPEIKNMVNDIIKTTGNAIVAKNMAIIDEIIEAKLQKLKDDEKGLESATSKDIVDLMKIVTDITVAKEKIETDNGSNTYIQILNGILK